MDPSENDRKVMAELVEEKAAKIIPAQGKWKVYFLGFSRSGWTSGALAYQEEINHHPVRGRELGIYGNAIGHPG